jgi:hypothetical protein
VILEEVEGGGLVEPVVADKVAEGGHLQILSMACLIS